MRNILSALDHGFATVNPTFQEKKRVKRLYKPGVKLIVVTYCKTPAEQQYVYDRVHELV